MANITEPHQKRVDTLYREYKRPLTKFLCALGLSLKDAEDLVNKTFERVLAMKNPERVAYWKAYLFKTAQNLLLTESTHRAMRQRNLSLIEDPLKASTPAPEWSLIYQHEVELFQRVVDRQPPSVKEVVILRFWDGLKTQEIIAHFKSRRRAISERTVNRYIESVLKEYEQELMAAEGLRQEELL